MKNSQVVWKNQKELRTGYTTGSCAAAASKAAARMLLFGEQISQVSLVTPNHTELYLDVEKIQIAEDSVSCAIRKYSGDDPDVTNGIYIYAEVFKVTEASELSEQKRVIIEGGEGVGRVTKRGLEQAIGDPAINKVPREMIRQAILEQMKECGYEGTLKVIISAPEGKELATKTFNPRLGIEGGISILGTTGIVEPMSEKALVDTIYVEMKMLKENGFDRCYVVPGNYGMDFLTNELGYDSEMAVKCSNYIGEVIDIAVQLEMKEILLIGHIGKLIKVAAGVMNTHSRQADCRMEILASHAGMAGAGTSVITELMQAPTTMEAIEILKREHMLETVMDSVMKKIAWHTQHRAGEKLHIEAITFSIEEGLLGSTEGTSELLERITQEQKNASE